MFCNSPLVNKKEANYFRIILKTLGNFRNVPDINFISLLTYCRRLYSIMPRIAIGHIRLKGVLQPHILKQDSKGL